MDEPSLFRKIVYIASFGIGVAAFLVSIPIILYGFVSGVTAAWAIDLSIVGIAAYLVYLSLHPEMSKYVNEKVKGNKDG
jgi:hypothetical protein